MGTKVHVYPRQNAGYHRWAELSVYWTDGSCTIDDPIMLTKTWIVENTKNGLTIPITFTCSGSATKTISINNKNTQHLQIVEVQVFSNNDALLDCKTPTEPPTQAPTKAPTSNMDVSPCTASFENGKYWRQLKPDFAIDGNISQKPEGSDVFVDNYGFAHSNKKHLSEFTVEWSNDNYVVPTKVLVYPKQSNAYHRYAGLSVYWTDGSCTIDDPVMLTAAWIQENNENGKITAIVFTCSGSATNTISINN